MPKQLFLTLLGVIAIALTLFEADAKVQDESFSASTDQANHQQADSIFAQNQRALDLFRAGNYESCHQVLSSLLLDLAGNKTERDSLSVVLVKANLANCLEKMGKAKESKATRKQAAEILEGLSKDHISLKGNLLGKDMHELAPTSASRQFAEHLVLGTLQARKGQAVKYQAPYLGSSAGDVPTIEFTEKKIVLAGSEQNAPNKNEPSHQAKQLAEWRILCLEAAKEKQSANFSQADILLQRSLKVAADFPKPNRQRAISLNLLGGVYRHTDRHDLAIQSYEESLEILKQTDGEHSQRYASTLDNLAQMYGTKGDFDKEASLQKQALSTYEACIGKNNIDYARTLSNLGDTYTRMGQLDEAEKLLLSSAEIQRNLRAESNRERGITLDNLSNIYLKRNNLAKAERYCKEALVILEKGYGPMHPDVAIAVHNLASIYLRQKRLELARPLIERELKILRHIYGNESIKVAEALMNFGQLYKNVGLQKDGEKLLEEAMSIRLPTRKIRSGNSLQPKVSPATP